MSQAQGQLFSPPFQKGDRVEVQTVGRGYKAWSAGVVVSFNKSGASVKLDGGHQGFHYWAKIRREQKRPERPWTNPTPLVAVRDQPAPTGEAEQIQDPLEALRQAIRVGVVLLTPDLARELVGRNEKNRAIRPQNMAKLRRAQAESRWKFNGDTICLAKSGRLLDGQHRCQMVIESGAAIPVILVEGLEEDVFDTKDIGAHRKASDVLHILGETNCKSLAAALGWVSRYLDGRMDDTGAVSTFTIADLLDDHRGLVDSVRRCTGFTLMAPSLMSALHYLFAQKDEEEAERFVKDLWNGAGLAQDDAVYLLRERLTKNKMSKAKLPNPEIAAITIKAWNRRREGMPLRNLRWRAGGDAAEGFPVVQ